MININDIINFKKNILINIGMILFLILFFLFQIFALVFMKNAIYEMQIESNINIENIYENEKRLIFLESELNSKYSSNNLFKQYNINYIDISTVQKFTTWDKIFKI